MVVALFCPDKGQTKVETCMAWSPWLNLGTPQSTGHLCFNHGCLFEWFVFLAAHNGNGAYGLVDFAYVVGLGDFCAFLVVVLFLLSLLARSCSLVLLVPLLSSPSLCYGSPDVFYETDVFGAEQSKWESRCRVCWCRESGIQVWSARWIQSVLVWPVSRFGKTWCVVLHTAFRGLALFAFYDRGVRSFRWLVAGWATAGLDSRRDSCVDSFVFEQRLVRKPAWIAMSRPTCYVVLDVFFCSLYSPSCLSGSRARS